MTLNAWTQFEPGCVISDSVNFINLDTRDFHWCLTTGDMSDVLSKVYNDFMMRSDEFKRHHTILAETLPFWVQFLYNKTGGAGEWRHLCYKSGNWLKYIWFIRVSDKEFAIYDIYHGFKNANELVKELDFDNEYAKAGDY